MSQPQSRKPFSSPSVIPSSGGQPLRTFVFFYSEKGIVDGYTMEVYLAESKLALAEWWCQGGKSTSLYEFDRQCQKLEPEELLQLIEEGYPEGRMSFELLEIPNRPTFVPPIAMIRAELNSYLIPDLTKIIIDLMESSPIYSEDESEDRQSNCSMEEEAEELVLLEEETMKSD